ncbi:carboxy-terminal domain RNA polymerase II polypeptide A small phosphatase 1-like [Chiloscyllium plagiosum]|uniref:carboxy-terminal domain RNA polymerase II polypeptide A small phosphatase 1-like n=1 Tax=Chiloscyllium plagiosum TaxID=36176 RepID=UPI001CB7D339|nr:carboxy-terminal domain RNA polymerase II polypeptide A small phosphatase 1-like [Chiloscyllium plagiosum]
MDNMSIITQVSKEELRTPLREKGRLSVSSKKLRQRSILRTIFCCLAHSEDDGDQALSNRNNNTSQVLDCKNSTSQTAVDHHLLPEVKVQDSGKKCVVIDLDETLVHSSFKPVSNADFIIPVEIDGNVHQVRVKIFTEWENRQEGRLLLAEVGNWTGDSNVSVMAIGIASPSLGRVMGIGFKYHCRSDQLVLIQ